MKTGVIMKRELFNQEISQDSKNEYFSATDLARAGNKWRIENNISPFVMSNWLQQDSVKEFIAELEKEYGKVLISGQGRGKHTWVHPYLFIKMALAINTKLEIKVYKWIYDELIKYRNSSGDSYKKMAGGLYVSIPNKNDFKDTLIEYANEIKKVCNVDNWESAIERQLKLRNDIQENISFLSDIIKDKNNLLSVSIKKALEENQQ